MYGEIFNNIKSEILNSCKSFLQNNDVQNSKMGVFPTILTKKISNINEDHRILLLGKELSSIGIFINLFFPFFLKGTGESGKSTILKQMRILCDENFNINQFQNFKSNIIQTFQDAALRFAQLLSESNQFNHLELHINMILESNNLDFQFCSNIKLLWSFEDCRNFALRCPDFQYLDCAIYFFPNSFNYYKPDFIITNQDILHARSKTTGINEAKFTYSRLNLKMIDVGGQRLERNGWIETFCDLQTVIFCVALSDYDQVLQENPNQNRMIESIALFEAIINSTWFGRASVVLFLNKIDLFQLKIPLSPLANSFKDYKGGSDIQKAVKYILYRFTNPKINRSNLKIYPHITQATDTQSLSLVFAALKRTILENAFNHIGFV